jgi:hypothetical protein
LVFHRQVMIVSFDLKNPGRRLAKVGPDSPAQTPAAIAGPIP